MDKKEKKSSSEIAGRYYSPDDYQKNDQVSSGLATTHEQVSDTFTEGEIGGVMEDVAGKDIPLERKGYDD